MDLKLCQGYLKGVFIYLDMDRLLWIPPVFISSQLVFNLLAIDLFMLNPNNQLWRERYPAHLHPSAVSLDAGHIMHLLLVNAIDPSLCDLLTGSQGVCLAHFINEVVLQDLCLETGGIILIMVKELSVKPPGGCSTCSWGSPPNQGRGVNVDDKQVMISDPTSCGHDVGVGDGNTGCRPYSINWMFALK
jgi:hypothetical protein